MNSKTTCILFDFDGVLANSYQFHLDAVIKSAHKLGLSLDKQSYDQFYPAGTTLKQGTINYLTSINKLELFDQYIAHKLAFDPQYKLNIQAIDGAIDFINQVKNQYQLAIVTGTRKILVDGFTNKYQLNNLFNPIITSENVSKSKPNPEGYKLAIKLLGINPSEAIIIEDGQSGIDAGNAAGIKTIGLELGSTHLQNTTYTCHSFPEIAQLLITNH